MSALAFLRRQPALFRRFLGFFQPPYVRFLHALVAVLVILQILSSSAMHMVAGHFAPGPGTWLASRYHLGAGLATVLFSLLLAAATLTRHGLRHFFPYLWGDTDQLKKDVLASLRLNMVPPRPRGLAAARTTSLSESQVTVSKLSPRARASASARCCSPCFQASCGSSSGGTARTFPAPPLSYTRALPRSWPSI